MAVTRGSTSQITIIKEVTPGTTPSTPTMLEMPIVSFTPNLSNTAIESDQIRGHPFVDKMLYGQPVHEFGMEYELQGAVHDALIETMFGATITSKSLSIVDALKSLTIEEKVKAGIFNQWTYGVFNSMSINVSAGDTTPIKITMGGLARTGTLDASSTLASSVTAAADVDPYIFVGASVEIEGNATPVGSITINIDREVNPLMLLGARLPREYVPGAVSVSGTLTVPYDDTGNGSGLTMSTIASGFTDASITAKLGDEAGTTWRQFEMGKTKFTSLGRSLSDRGMRMQEINWTAIIDPVTGTACKMTTQ